MLPAHCQPPSTFWKPVRTESGGPWLSQAVLRLVSGEACVCVSASDTEHGARRPRASACPGGQCGNAGHAEPRSTRFCGCCSCFQNLPLPTPRVRCTQITRFRSLREGPLLQRRAEQAVPLGRPCGPAATGFSAEHRHSCMPRSLVSGWPCKGRAVLHRDMVTVHQLRELHS